MTNWPALIKFEGDDELTYVASETAWLRDAESHLYGHRGDDVLIDSSGRVFRLDHTGDGAIFPIDTGTSIPLEEFIRLVRVHASGTHRCCIEKISFRTVAEGVTLVADMNEHD